MMLPFSVVFQTYFSCPYEGKKKVITSASVYDLLGIQIVHFPFNSKGHVAIQLVFTIQ